MNYLKPIKILPKKCTRHFWSVLQWSTTTLLLV